MYSWYLINLNISQNIAYLLLYKIIVNTENYIGASVHPHLIRQAIYVVPAQAIHHSSELPCPLYTLDI